MGTANPLKRELLRVFWLVGPVGRCTQVTAVSEATKRDVVRYTGCPPEKIVVIPTVIGGHFRPTPKEFDRRRPRVLQVGTAANKNLERHAQALAGLGCVLHVIGELSPQQRAILKHNGIEHFAEHDVDRERVRGAFEQCDVLLFASTIEGFGMPIVEAQTVGRVVVTSNASSMPEVAGRGAELVDPFDVRDIRRGLERVIDDEARRRELIAEGFANVRRFAADRVAASYAEVYRRALEHARSTRLSDSRRATAPRSN
jgi:glycosyltransferase involved in cell wall biosynthesis